MCFCMFNSMPEPPTLNAILVMQAYASKVRFVRNNISMPPEISVPPETYPALPDLVEVGSPCYVSQAQSRGALWKFQRFVHYLWVLRRELRQQRPDLVVIHDYLALLAFSWVRPVSGFRGLVWFNSYDVIEPTMKQGRFSLMWLVARHHARLFAELDFFSLPAKERLGFYPVERVRRETFVIPNFPAQAFYRRFRRPRRLAAEPVLRLIYQGALGWGHGFEAFIAALATPVQGRRLELTLKGWIKASYREELEQLAARLGVSAQLSFVGFGPYREVPKLAATKDVGLAIFTGQDVMNRTLGTASNKIYEYAALGLPVLLYDTPHFRHHLGGREWAFFTDLSPESLAATLERIVVDYEAAANAAIRDFDREFNYERVFEPALERVLAALPAARA